MDDRRRFLVLGLVAAGGIAVGVLVTRGCDGADGEAAADAVAGAEASDPAASNGAPGADPSGDALLSSARASIREGEISDEARAALAASSEPGHDRARRLLEAMEGTHAGEPGGGVEADGGAPSGPPPILPPAEGTDPATVSTSSATRTGDGGSSSHTSSSSRSGTTRSRSTSRVGTLSLRSSKRGATLTIAAPSALVVGVAHQPASGLVRLVIEKAQAGGSVLSSRPRIQGAQVTAVRQGRDTVQITLRLDPGWTFGGVKPFSGGARVQLNAPQ